jgi:hypothetical protein
MQFDLGMLFVVLPKASINLPENKFRSESQVDSRESAFKVGGQA